MTDIEANNSDEISLGEVILLVKDFIQEIFKYKLLLLLSILLFAGLLGFRTYNKTPMFSGALSFMLQGESGNAIPGILGQLGFGSMNSGSINLQKMADLMQSRKIITQVLFERSTINDKNDFLVNHLIDVYEYHKSWKKSTNETLRNGFYFKHDSIPRFSRLENQVVGSIYIRLTAGQLTIKPTDMGIMKVSMICPSQEFIVEFLASLYENISVFYQTKSVEKYSSIFKKISTRADSLARIVNNTERKLANAYDQNYASARFETRVKQGRLERELEERATIYLEALKNKEIARFNLESQTPIVQLIDAPILPLSKSSGNYKLMTIVGAMLGATLFSLLIVFRKIIRDALKGEDKEDSVELE